LTGGATAAPEVQALLRALATGRDIAELGAAYGETAALLAQTARSVVTVEADPERVVVARERLRGIANVELLEGDAYERLRGRGPFGLVFADGGRPVREFLLRDPRLAAAEILATPAMAVIVASRLR